MNAFVLALDAACPGCQSDEKELAYIWMGQFVRHVADAHVAGRKAEVQAVFDVVETELGKRFSPHLDLAIVGFLEDMQNGNLHENGSKPADFRAYLGPRSLERWEALNGFWGAVDHHNGRKP